MPNKPVPAAAEGVPSVIDVIDRLSDSRAMLDLITYALAAMCVGGDPEINALQMGTSKLRDLLDDASDMLNAHWEAVQ